jgi:hypothetical protein
VYDAKKALVVKDFSLHSPYFDPSKGDAMNVLKTKRPIAVRHLTASGGIITRQENKCNTHTGGIITRSTGGIITRSSGGVMTRNSFLGGVLPAFTLIFSIASAAHEKPTATEQGMRRSSSWSGVRRTSGSSSCSDASMGSGGASSSDMSTSRPSNREHSPPHTGVSRRLAAPAAGAGTTASGMVPAASGPFMRTKLSTDEEALARHRIFTLDLSEQIVHMSGAGERQFPGDLRDISISGTRSDHLSSGLSRLLKDGAPLDLAANLAIAPLDKEEDGLLQFAFDEALYAKIKTEGACRISAESNCASCIRTSHSAILERSYYEYGNSIFKFRKFTKPLLYPIYGILGYSPEPTRNTRYNPVWYMLGYLDKIIGRYIEIGGDNACDLDIIASIITPLMYKARTTKATSFQIQEESYSNLFRPQASTLKKLYYTNRYMLGPVIAAALVLSERILSAMGEAVAKEPLALLRSLNRRLMTMNKKTAHPTQSVYDRDWSPFDATMRHAYTVLSVLQIEPHLCGEGILREKRSDKTVPTIYLYDERP